MILCQILQALRSVLIARISEKEAYFPQGKALFGRDRHPSECDCRRAERERLEKRDADEKHNAEVERLKREGFSNPAMRHWTFENDNGKCPQIGKAYSYVEKWETVRTENLGYLLWGNVGSGKSYFAGCIANALMERLHDELCNDFEQPFLRLGKQE